MQWVMDVAICNAGGIWLGICFCRFLEVREYNWELDNWNEMSFSERVRRGMLKVIPGPGEGLATASATATATAGDTAARESSGKGGDGKAAAAKTEVVQEPQSQSRASGDSKRQALQRQKHPDFRGWTVIKWDPTASRRRYIACIFTVLGNMVLEMNAFMLKAVFEIPSQHIMNVYRLFFWAFVCLPAVRQVYMFSIDASVARLGAHAWAALGCCITECMVILKFGFLRGVPAPLYPDGEGVLVVVLYYLLCLVLFTTPSAKARTFVINQENFYFWSKNVKSITYSDRICTKWT